MSEQKEKEGKNLAMELMKKKIVHIKGKKRQEATVKYRRLLSDLAEKPVNFERS